MLSKCGAIVGVDRVDDLVDSTAFSQFSMEDEEAFGGLSDAVLKIGVGDVGARKNGLC